MATAQDQAVGGLFLFIATAVWLYYTAWVFLLPFADADHFLHALFLPREYAILIPTALLVVGVSGIAGFIALSVAKSNAKKKAKAQKKAN
ncbi:hypothetical protein AMAG_03963 [Allomyces macrogynus ATCC 38327]|uniref:Dolichol phosphate-mannose biosynthesis regulatory protein n=1 Tax=Allomyces macrogynus (strain ATCC 38327) TaxID=578462 RepID=A0A0L0S7P6_ALLM3|nr:hypothetical protein AMAG_03963 [Allomyces macrogynus ATCC 38327]|eukprot:KNE58384.1 hypothetical protein AMAG_03963 [Allomyces macrogynus ATCC 38327]